MTEKSNKHVTVLRDEAIEALRLQHDATVIDATLGSGGHSALALNILDEKGMLIGLDRDQEAIDAAGAKFEEASAPTHFLCRNFRDIDIVAEEVGVEKVDAILADLGWRMEQFSEGGRGFSFAVDEPLHMTFGDPESYAFTARDIANDWDVDDIKNVIKAYGEERFAPRIARAIVAAREEASIETSVQLSDIVRGAVPGFYRNGKTHPATKTFQAFRIAVNDEFDALSEFIEKSVALLAPGGRLAIISFHSLEDRIVKRAFRSHAARGDSEDGRIVTKKPITATKEELLENPRARSAKLRVFEKFYEKENNTTIL